MTASLSRRTTHAAAWSSVGTIVQFASTGVTLPITSRLIEPEFFGAVALGLSIVTVALGFFLGIISQAIVEPTELTEDDTNLLWAYALVAGTLSMGLFMLVAFRNGALDSSLDQALVLLSPIVLLRLIGRVARADRLRDLDFRMLTVGQAVSYILGYAAVSIGLALLGFDLLALAGGLVVQESLQTACYLLSGRVGRPTAWAPRRSLLAATRTYGSVGVASLLNFLSNQIDTFTVGATLGVVNLGQYSRAYRLSSLPVNAFGDSVGLALFPAFTAVRSSDTRTARAAAGGLLATLAIMMPISAAGALHSHELVLLVLGPGWDQAAGVLQVISVVAPLRIIMKVTSSVFRARAERAAFAGISATQVVVIGAGGAFGSLFGLTGAAIGIALGQVFAAIVALTMLTRRVPGLSTELPMVGSAALLGLLGAVATARAVELTSNLPVLVRATTTAFGGMIASGVLISFVARRSSASSAGWLIAQRRALMSRTRVSKTPPEDSA